MPELRYRTITKMKFITPDSVETTSHSYLIGLSEKPVHWKKERAQEIRLVHDSHLACRSFLLPFIFLLSVTSHKKQARTIGLRRRHSAAPANSLNTLAV